MERENDPMSAILSLGMGYLIGCISPAAWLSKKKHVNLKEEGTGNLGATNTALVLGKAAGIFVMCFDIAKSFFSYKIARFLFPNLLVAGILACIGCIIGHCFPFTMGFHGGKGLASFVGMTLAMNFMLGIALLVLLAIITVVTDFISVGAMSLVIVMPIAYGFLQGSLTSVLIISIASLVMLWKHRENIVRIRNHTEIGLRSAAKGENRIK